MDNHIVAPFVEAVTELMSSMMELNCSVTPVAELEPFYYVSGIITLSGSASGQVAISLSREVGIQLVAKMLSIEPEAVDEEILRDGVGEMANMVAGSAKSKTAALGLVFRVSLPTIVSGGSHHVGFFKSQEVRHQRVQSDLGSFALSVWVAPS